jgi:cytochrome c oxidase assembly protein subunit 15
MSYQRTPFWVAVLAALFTLPLVYLGGTVTTYRVGLAVPDWPRTFGENMFLYDFWNAPFGVRLEHTHRLYGAAVGFATIFLCVWFLVFEPRRWLKSLGVLALLAVVVQGILGGTRVTQVSTVLAAIHGISGQVFFGLIVALCVFTSRKWIAARQPVLDQGQIRWLATAILCAVAIQIGLGSWFRHFGALATIVFHALLAVTILSAAIFVLVKVERNRPELATLAASARMLTVLTAIQLVLGASALGSLWPLDGIPRPSTFFEAVVRTSHQTDGALVLAASVVLCLRSWRQLAPRDVAELASAREEAKLPGRAAAGGLDWEAVA